MMRSSTLALLPAALLFTACNAVDSFNAVGEDVEEEMAKQQAEATAEAEEPIEAEHADADAPAGDKSETAP
ncbi:MAG: hypothetical protein IBJ13_06110 [Sphingopyxis sp.]|nr:hypothetical protein [Sphingopyxis sp.]